jgi:hypothetical protein
MFPIIYKPENSIKVYEKTQEFLQNNTDISDKISELLWTYQSLHNLIPTTIEQFWSGHAFPFIESYDELQISFNLVCFGFYKQAMISLRNALELGLLSIYYNINDDGHTVVKKWLSSNKNKEADTPRIKDIWNILIKNRNISIFQEKIDIKQKLLDLEYLHNYVHTKGFFYSNRLGKLKSNSQTFEVDYIHKWLETFKEIVIIVLTLHLLKYPNGLLRYDYSTKFGINIPNFSHLDEHEIDKIQKYFSNNYFTLLETICLNDPNTVSFFEWLKSLPDISEEEIENQIIEMDKFTIESNGFLNYKAQEIKMMNVNDFDELPDKIKNRINKLEKWANEKDFIKPQWKMNS